MIVEFKDKQGYLCLAVWRGKQAKPFIYTRYKTSNSREAQIEAVKMSESIQLTNKAQRAMEKKNFQHGLSVGDILYSSWGYDQTNIDFYQVTGVNGKQVKIREIAGSTEETGFMSGDSVAVPDSFCGKEMVKIPQPSGKDCYIKVSSCAHAWPWDGTPKRCSWYA